MGFHGGSAGKESACSAGDLGSIPGLGRSPGEGIGYPPQYSWASLVAQQVQNLPAMPGSIPGFGRPSGERKGYPLQYSDLKNSMDCIVHGVIKRWTWLSAFHFSLLHDKLRGLPSDLDSKESACNMGDLSLISELGRSPGDRNDNPLKYSCLENSMDRRAWWATVHGVAKSQTRLNE